MILDRCGKTNWKEKVFTDSEEFNGHKIKTWGMKDKLHNSREWQTIVDEIGF